MKVSRATLLAQIAEMTKEAQRTESRAKTTSNLRDNISKFYNLIATHGSPDVADYLELEGRRAINFASFLNRLCERLGTHRRVMLVGDLRKVGVLKEDAWEELRNQMNEVIFVVAERFYEGDLTLDEIDRAITDASGYSPAERASQLQHIANLWAEVERLKQEYASLPPRTRHGLIRGWVFYNERTGYWQSLKELDLLEFISQRLLSFLRRQVERELALKDLADGRRRKLKHANAKIEKRVRALLMMGNLWQAFEDVRWGSDYKLEDGKRVFKPVRAEIAREFIAVWRGGRVVDIKTRFCYNRTRTRWIIGSAMRASRLRAGRYEKAFLRRAK